MHPNLTTIDYLVIRHPHRDHVELLADVVEKFTVKQVWDSGRVHPICGYRHLIRESAKIKLRYRSARFGAGSHGITFPAKKRCYDKKNLGVRTFTIKHGEKLTVATTISLGANATMTLLHASASTKGKPSINSVVVRLKLGKTFVLLTGDAEGGSRKSWPKGPTAKSVEGKLLACCKKKLKADVLISGHRGSKTSARGGFIKAVKPSIVIVSSGPHKYGSKTLPDPGVMTFFRMIARVFRTDRDDKSCKTAAKKIGPTNDGKAGGCDNIRVRIPRTGKLTVQYISVP